MLEKFILFFCFFLPFQFALNPFPGIDLGVARVLALAIFFCWLIRKKFKIEKSLFIDKISLSFLLFLIVCFLSIFLSSNFIWSWRKLIFLFSFAPLFFVIRDLSSDHAFARRMIKSFVWGSFFLAFLGLVQFILQFVFGIETVYAFLSKWITPIFLGKELSKEVLAYPSWLVSSNNTTYMRAFGLFPDPHMFSYYLGMLLPFAIWLGFAKKINVLYIFFAFIIVTADLLSFSRGGYMALFFGGLAVLPLVSKRAAKKIVFAMISLVVILYFIPNPVGPRLNSTFDTQEGSNQGRIFNWQQAISIIKSHPMGTGIGAYSLAVDPKAQYRDPIYAHNLYLDIAAEMSIIGLLLFSSIIFFSFKKLLQNTRINSFYVAAFSSLVIFSIHSLVETPLYSIHVLPLLLALTAISSHAKNETTNL